MASLVSEPSGLYRIDFMRDRKRQSIRTGLTDRKLAVQFQGHVEHLVDHIKTGRQVPASTAAWVADLPVPMVQRLQSVGLVEVDEPDAKPVVRLGEFLNAYLGRRNDLRPASLLVLGNVLRNLKDYYGDDRDISSITPAHADDFARWLATGARTRGKADKTIKGLSPATCGKRLQWCAAIFRDAVRRKLIGENPFDGLKLPKGSNPERQVYVPAATIERLIESTPDSEWKCLLAMSRCLGLRVPTEPFSLTWSCVDWERQRIKVLSPKTECHGKPFRWVPILPDVRPHLDRLFEEAEEGATHVFARLRQRDSLKAAEKGFWASVNLRQQFLDLIQKAGISPWPRLWHNLRASAQTDLANRFPAHVVCEWLGNSEAVAKEHYLQVTDQHFEAAIQGGGNPQHFPQQRAADMPSNAIIAAPQKAKNPCKTGVSLGVSGGGGN